MTYPIPDSIRDTYVRELVVIAKLPLNEAILCVEEAWNTSVKCQLVVASSAGDLPKHLKGFAHSLAATFVTNAMHAALQILIEGAVMGMPSSLHLIPNEPSNTTPAPPSNGGQFK